MAPTLHARQSSTSSNSSCPSTISGGGIAGIVIGSIAGTLLLLWLWRLCTLPGVPIFGKGTSDWADGRGTGGIGGTIETRRRVKRRSSPVEYVEKPSRSRRRHRDDVRRPAKVYLS